MPKKSEKTGAAPRMTAVWIVVMFLFIGELFFYTWCRVQFVKVGYEISKATHNQRSLMTQQDNLKIEIARLKSPERLSRLAKKFRLTTPRPEQMVVIR